MERDFVDTELSVITRKQFLRHASVFIGRKNAQVFRIWVKALERDLKPLGWRSLGCVKDMC